MPSFTSSCSASTALSTSPDLDMNKGREGTPTVTLDADEITQEMAARLTIALLGQMLYMKGQVPFPVASLSRMADNEATENVSRTAIRAMKRRLEFLQSYDDIASHLRTTFVALSTALAKNENEYPICRPSISTSMPSSARQNTCPKTRRRPAKVHILLILGPSPSTAKARYLLELDGFRVEQFGEWQYSCCNRNLAKQGQCSCESEGEFPGSNESVSPTRVLDSPTTPQRLSSENLDKLDSPCSSSPGAASYLVSVPSSPSVSDDGGSSNGSTGFPDELDPFLLEQRAEEASLRSGERLLYRALFAGDEGLGFGDEISPTQAHVFIHAPRRFTHPTWVPRQSLGRMLDRQVNTFLESESGINGTKKHKPRNNNVGFGVGLPTLGVRIKCKGEKESSDAKPSGTIDSRNSVLEDENEGEENKMEEDELIWWSWDGKLVGFTD